MATPTTAQLGAVPSPASKKTAMHNSVSTPGAYSLSSPAPRSVPSPATTRKDLSGKTPIGHGTTGSSSGSKTVGGTPMVLNLSQQGATMSPMPNMGFSGLTPQGLGVDLGTPGHLSVATPGLGANMMPTMSELGLTASGSVKRNEDEERRTKMRRILKSIGKPTGRVSEDGIARLSRRVGLVTDIDAEKLTVEERGRRVGNRTIQIAGNTIVIDVDLAQHVPKDVRVEFSNDMAKTGDQTQQAGKILLDDLTPRNVPQINQMLDRFALNLKRLARLDRLSTQKVNCFEALSGIYASLKRLYDQELKLALDMDGVEQTKAQTDVTNKQSGRPRFHEDGALGLSVTYWTDNVSRAVRKDAMELDDVQESQAPTASKHIIWFETERCPAAIYPSIRITDAWLPDPLDATSPIPWQEPVLTYVPPDTEDMTDDSSSQTLPDIRFVAKFDPPLVLPWQVAANLYTAVGSNIAPAFQVPPTYLSLLLDSTHGASSLPLTSHAQVLRPTEEGFTKVKHIYKINAAKYDHGFRLEELPFSHPRQIVELMPILRQWLGMNNLLLNQLNAGSADMSVTKDVRGSSLDALLSNTVTKNSDELPVECVLVMTDTPTMCLTFALPDNTLHNAEIQVLPNAELLVMNDNSHAGLATKALNLCGNLGVWIEWFRGRGGS